jgi:hypothetical protein
MILLTLLLLVQQSAMPHVACPNLSGRYVIQWEDGRVYPIIAQTRCDRIKIDWVVSSYMGTSRTTHVLPLDGKFHVDSGWFGEREKRLTSAQFRSGVLEIVSKSEQSKGAAAFAWKMSFELLPDKDLCKKFFDSSGVPSVRRAARQKGKDQAGEDEAAQRSEENC